MSVVVVTDSTAYLPDQLARRYAPITVPLHVSVDGADSVEEGAFGPDELVAALHGRHRVTTSGATYEELARVYRRALDTGADAVVSVHLSRYLSGTWDAARAAAADVSPELIRVVDSRSTAMGLGFPVLAAAEAARVGSDPSAVEAAARGAVERTRTMFSVRTLDHLRRGGRIGTAAALVGTALAVKPLLHVSEGRIEVLEKVRTTARAVNRLVDVSAHAAGTGPVAAAVHHLAAPQLAEQLAERINTHLPEHQECVVSEVGAVIGAHIGPGSVGAVILPGGWEGASR